MAQSLKLAHPIKGAPMKNTGIADEAMVQASFDFLPQEMRLQRRYGSASGIEAARRRAQLRLIDRQAAGLGSRIVAARLREILKPSAAPGEVSADALVAARAELREIGNAVFYFSAESAEESAPAHRG